MEGTVFSTRGYWNEVLINKKIVKCRLRGKMRQSKSRFTNPIAVGDKVKLIEDKSGNYLIESVLDRKNYIIRQSNNLSKDFHVVAANVDLALLFITVNYPITTTTFIDRFLVSAKAYGVPVKLMFNKTDLYNDKELAKLNELTNLYENLGYTTDNLSAKDLNQDQLQVILRDFAQNFIVLAGHSGTGKSTFINAVLGSNIQKINDLTSFNKGAHTTTFSKVFCKNDIILTDTPGLKDFGIIGLDISEIKHYFQEFLLNKSQCEYHNCMHIDESKCAVKIGVNKGNIANSRYSSYLNIVKELDTNKITY